MIKIDKGVPPPSSPPDGHHRRGFPKYPWGKMKVGDSFFLKGKASPGSVHTSARWFRGYENGDPNLRISTLRVDGGIRVWRVA